ncbi:MAG: hypothetical protein WBA68_07930 [Alteraurantiacibacter sp.]
MTKRHLIFLALCVLATPLLAVQFATPVEASDTAPRRAGMSYAVPLLGGDPGAEAGLASEAKQVRIERRVVIRIGPARPAARQQMLADLPRRPLRRRYAEAEFGECMSAGNIVGVQPTSDNRLLIFARPDMILAAELENGCTARAFYAGFYTERNDDGQICAGRDRLQSRAGANCQIANFTRLVAASD